MLELDDEELELDIEELLEKLTSELELELEELSELELDDEDEEDVGAVKTSSTTSSTKSIVLYVLVVPAGIKLISHQRVSSSFNSLPEIRSFKIPVSASVVSQLVSPEYFAIS
jgi:hypothetical protein